MTADSPIHGSAMLMMNSGSLISGKPSLGSWVNYGLGSANENLPGYVVMLDKTGGPISGAKNWSSGYMPASYQGTVFRSKGEPILNLETPRRRCRRPSSARCIDSLNRPQPRAPQHPRSTTATSPRASPATSSPTRCRPPRRRRSTSTPNPSTSRNSTGMDDGRTEDFGRKCLLARRLVERGVRFIQIYSGGAHNDANWDAHGDLVKNHNHHAGNTDKPIAGLLKDLKQRGLLDETLVVWGGEFGRQPTAEYAKGTGRDHNAYGFTMWMAGGGIKGGTSYRRDRRTRRTGRRATASTCATSTPPSCTRWASTPTRSQLLLQRPGSEAGRGRRRRSD